LNQESLLSQPRKLENKSLESPKDLPLTSEADLRLKELLDSRESQEFMKNICVPRDKLRRFIEKEANWIASQTKRKVDVEDVEEAWDTVVRKGDLGIWPNELRKQIEKE